MDIEQARQDIARWITDFVEQPHPLLNGWPPCPFARQARVNDQLDIRAGITDPYADLRPVEMANFMVIAYVYDRDQMDADRFAQQIHAVNQAFLVPRDMIALADHPDAPEEILGVSMNQGTYAIAFVQSLSKLNHFARQIAPKGYYRDWPKPYLAELFQWREDPRA